MYLVVRQNVYCVVLFNAKTFEWICRKMLKYIVFIVKNILTTHVSRCGLVKLFSKWNKRVVRHRMKWRRKGREEQPPSHFHCFLFLPLIFFFFFFLEDQQWASRFTLRVITCNTTPPWSSYKGSDWSNKREKKKKAKCQEWKAHHFLCQIKKNYPE